MKCEVHQIREGDPLRVVRIRAAGFQGKKCIVQISRVCNKQPCTSAYFEAVYADDAYMKDRRLAGDNLVFMSKPCRELLRDERKDLNVGDLVDLEEIQGKGLLSLYAVHRNA